ncbi:MAG: hypothetical protein JOZ69_21405, partial [Myxococcales bacterium]|nr:hypothetical protein [Myxococcales bacterium]
DRDHPRLRQVALIAVHVVYTIPGHPEFVWASFQHIDPFNNYDTAGIADHIPKLADPHNQNKSINVCPVDPTGQNGPVRYLLCKADTTANAAMANTPLDESKLALGGVDGQTFFVAKARRDALHHDRGDLDLSHVPRLEVEHGPGRRRRLVAQREHPDRLGASAGLQQQ